MDIAMNMLEAVLGSPWLFLLILTATAVDVVFPIVPAETLLITAGVSALSGTPNPWILILAACIGAMIGDFSAHLLGRGTGWLSRRIARSPRGESVLLRTRRLFDRRGGAALIAGRFVPGGRTATTLVSGMLRYPWNRFLLFSSIGALAWAVYCVGIGMLGGMMFRERPLLGIVVGVALALAITGLIEAARHLNDRRTRSGHAQERIQNPGAEGLSCGFR